MHSTFLHALGKPVLHRGSRLLLMCIKAFTRAIVSPMQIIKRILIGNNFDNQSFKSIFKNKRQMFDGSEIDLFALPAL